MIVKLECCCLLLFFFNHSALLETPIEFSAFSAQRVGKESKYWQGVRAQRVKQFYDALCKLLWISIETWSKYPFSSAAYIWPNETISIYLVSWDLISLKITGKVNQGKKRRLFRLATWVTWHKWIQQSWSYQVTDLHLDLVYKLCVTFNKMDLESESAIGCGWLGCLSDLLPPMLFCSLNLNFSTTIDRTLFSRNFNLK